MKARHETKQITKSFLFVIVSVSNMERYVADESLAALRMKSREHSAALGLMHAGDNGRISAGF